MMWLILLINVLTSILFGSLGECLMHQLAVFACFPLPNK